MTAHHVDNFSDITPHTRKKERTPVGHPFFFAVVPLKQQLKELQFPSTKTMIAKSGTARTGEQSSKKEEACEKE